MKKNISEAELDQILKSVDEMVESLAKADPVKDEDDAPAMSTEQAPAQDAAPAEAPAAEQAPEAPAQEQAPAEAPAAEQAPEAPAQENVQAEEQQMEELSDEELQEIYASMPKEEAERHLMILSQIVQGQQAQAPEAPAAAPAAAPMAPAAKSEKAQKIAELAKAEKDNENLKKENEEMKKSLEIATRAIELALRPIRKSAATMADVQIIDKGIAEKKDLSDKEIKSELDKKVSDSSLTKSDRDAINDYFFTGSGKERMLEIIGGKK